MADERGSDDELYRWEAACFAEVDAQPNYEQQLHDQRQLTNQKLWHLFQNSATCIAHLHKGASSGGGGGIVSSERGGSRWVPFQTAAGSVTALYKESMDGVRRCAELGVLHGQQRRMRELMTLLRRRRLLRREEVLALLCGRPPPPPAPPAATQTQTPTPARHRTDGSRQCPAWAAAGRERSSPSRTSPRPTPDTAAWNGVPVPLLVGLHPPAPPAAAFRRPSPGRRRDGRSLSPLDLTPVKRPATPSSPCDVVMDSPTHKRPRYT